MRNSKVRRRIAAGKLRLRIRDLRNLGPRSEVLLERIGVRSVEALRRRGAVEAYLALRRVGATRSLNMLWAMAGALDPWPEGRDWRDVAAGEQRLALLLAVDGAGGAERDPGPGAAPRRVRRRAAKAAAPGGGLGDWAPGLPFDEHESGAGAKADGRRTAGADAPADLETDADGEPAMGFGSGAAAASRRRAPPRRRPKMPGT